jgi:hypothetical protein
MIPDRCSRCGLARFVTLVVAFSDIEEPAAFAVADQR